MNQKVDTAIQIKALKMLESDYEKLSEKARQKREKEIIKIRDKFKQFDGMTEVDLANQYGYELISYDEYKKALKDLEELKELGQTAEDSPTPLSEYLRMIRNELKNTRVEIQELQEELSKK